jgi:hypothetical protein
MKGLKQFILEKMYFDNWVKPDAKALEHEYKYEYEIKPLKTMTNNAFPTLKSFLDAARNGTVMVVTPAIDRKIAYRSHTTSKEQLISLIKGYASYPQYRNEKTIEGIYNGFRNNERMTMAVVLRLPNGSLRIMGGNTRMDIATHLGLAPKVLVIDVPQTA